MSWCQKDRFNLAPKLYIFQMGYSKLLHLIQLSRAGMAFCKQLSFLHLPFGCLYINCSVNELVKIIIAFRKVWQAC